MSPVLLPQQVVFQDPSLFQVSTAQAGRISALSTTSLGGLLSSSGLRATFTSADVQAQLPLVGFAERSAAVGERLAEPPALEAYRYALDGKQTVLSSLVRLIRVPEVPDPAGRRQRPGISLDDLSLAGFALTSGVTPAAGRRTGTIGDFAAHPGDYTDTDLLTGDIQKRHESDYFAAAVAAIDNAIALMRLAEGRVDYYTRMLADARTVRTDIAARIGGTDPRLRAIEGQLAEARHDVATTSALLAEEQARVAGVNARRTAVLQQYVSYLAFRRPRVVNRETIAPISPADAAIAEDAVAVCMRSHPFVPEELRAMADLFRDAPIRWLPPLWPHLQLLDTSEAVLRTFETVQRRAPYTVPLLQQQADRVSAGGASRYLAAASMALAGQRQVLATARMVGLQLNMGAVSQLSLTAARVQLLDAASAADLMDGTHGRPELGRRTAQELDRIAQVASCLYGSFGEVLPVIRLAWAELLATLAAPVPLQDLTALPRWGELPVALRREQQGLADWLYSRIDPANAAAVSAMNEVIRVAALMASHAPVDQIVGAAIARSTPARIGGRLDLAVDVSQVRIGMSVLVRDATGGLLAHAIVDDIDSGLARARIARAPDQTVMITAASRVHLTNALPAFLA